MNIKTILLYGASFVAGVFSRPLLEPLVAPFVGPQAAGPLLSVVIASALGIWLMHRLTANKLEILTRMWDSPTPTPLHLVCLLLSFVGMVYAAAVVFHAPGVDKALHAAAGWALLLNFVTACATCVTSLRSLARRASVA
mgnify:CR=1 FL=1